MLINIRKILVKRPFCSWPPVPFSITSGQLFLMIKSKMCLSPLFASVGGCAGLTFRTVISDFHCFFFLLFFLGGVLPWPEADRELFSMCPSLPVPQLCCGCSKLGLAPLLLPMQRLMCVLLGMALLVSVQCIPL